VRGKGRMVLGKGDEVDRDCGRQWDAACEVSLGADELGK
jgi:hypothetical protein